MNRLQVVACSAVLLGSTASALSLRPVTAIASVEPLPLARLNRSYSFPRPWRAGTCAQSLLGNRRFPIQGSNGFVSGRETLSPIGGVLGGGFCTASETLRVNVEQEILTVALNDPFIRFKPRFVARLDMAY